MTPTSSLALTPDWASWPPLLARQWRTVLVRLSSGSLALVSDRPADRYLLQRLESEIGRRVDWQQAPTAAIDDWLATVATQDHATSGDMAHPVSPGSPSAPAAGVADADVGEPPSPVIRLVEDLLHDALRHSASDVHIERDDRGAAIRLRIDGVMSTVGRIDSQALAEQSISRLKVMAELDIGERRIPQDGRFRQPALGRMVDFRLSIMPASHGEDAVIRVLDRVQSGAGPSGRQDTRAGLSLEALGFEADMAGTLRELAQLPHGMLLVTGPTGSGKTTTLYATLASICDGHEKIITIEDPVEMQLPGVVQIPVNERKGLDFARGLRSILRHDPDRVMVGEIRDADTAQIAVQAALTGHLVFSTVHANHAFDVIGRFMHMGLDPYHVVSALNAVLAQRLVRLVCPDCARDERPPPVQLASFGLQARGHHFQRGAGCPACRGTGYRGRKAVCELLRLDDELRDLIVARAPLSRLKAAARERGQRSLRAHALQWVCQGLTTFDELTRVTLAD